MQAIASDVPLVVSDDVLASEIDEEIVMLHINKGTYFGIDGVGALIWKLLAKPITPDAIVAAVAEEFDVTSERCRQDVLAFCSELVEADLIVQRP